MAGEILFSIFIFAIMAWAAWKASSPYAAYSLAAVALVAGLLFATTKGIDYRALEGLTMAVGYFLVGLVRGRVSK
ncbi:hypothetical protein [Phreatobacter stygius]|uniref:Uncharacterized protein n=1 Tax=Phreatobacter stygius TaxID=1940610 RepID=A0A4D7BDA4_9HYPH|nr:hypothetical protein [Phreatobacter stygius]QCI68840.1 hypothetical protein E8M01_34190 [Phreatobacter stygius]